MPPSASAAQFRRLATGAAAVVAAPHDYFNAAERGLVALGTAQK
jgi:hypothetical protein